MLYTPDYEGAVLFWAPDCAGDEVARFLDKTADMAAVIVLNEAARDQGGHVQWFVGGRVFTGSCYEQGLAEEKQ